ncbi:MAG: alpha/beta hydrolase family protein [Capsulimonadaceae bacterium]|nr:alpha/beta hydrolase family protein [Capsulimonadaceae bacterium]
MDRRYSPSQFHEMTYSATMPRLAFRGQEIGEWREQLDIAFHQVLGWQADKRRGPLNVEILEEEATSTYVRRKLVFESEPDSDVPCHLLVPNGVSECRPAFVCLQGHTTGMHISLGQAVGPRDQAWIDEEQDFAVQAARQGYIALAIEQRSFGLREERLQRMRSANGCEDAAMHALLLGRTLAAERAWDVSRAIDLLETIPGVDRGRIGCVGNSGGGSATYYSACVDKRISLALPSCSVCTYADSIFRIHHCSCNYLPGILKVAEMGDLAGLIAPRKLIVVAGDEDDIFPIDGVRKAYAAAERIYAAAGASDHIRLIVGNGGHRFFAEPAWAAVRELL